MIYFENSTRIGSPGAGSFFLQKIIIKFVRTKLGLLIYCTYICSMKVNNYFHSLLKLSKMNNSSAATMTENAIYDLATENFNLYPESYPLNDDGTATDEASESVQDLATNYFENRTELDAERDEKADVTEIDYVEICMAAFAEWVQNQ